MTQPGLFVSFAGRPRVCAALFVVYGILLMSWFEGGISWWVGLIVLSMAMRTFNAYGQLKRYNTWLAAWNAMGEDDGPSPTPQKQPSIPQASASRWLTMAAGALAIFIPMFGGQQPSFFKLLWIAAFFFLCWKGALKLRRVLGFSTKAVKPASAQGKVDSVKDVAVAWLLPRASSSPSRIDAMRCLPDYSARLIGK